MKRFLLGLMLLPLLAWADTPEAPEAGHVKMTRMIQHTRLAEDFSYETEAEIEYKVLTEQGARQEGRFPVVYNRALSEMEIVLAETIKADGRRLPVPASGIARQSGSLGTLTIKDLEVISLAFPDLAAGDSVHVIHRSRNKPLFPGSYSFANAITTNLIQENIEIHLEAPEKLVLQLSVEGFKKELDEVSQGRRKLAWRYQSLQTKTPEPMQTDARISQAHVWISSFASWDAMAQSYRELYQPQAALTPEITALAKELTQGASTDRDKAQRLYDWVRKNIRYVAIYAGIESWVPHQAAQVLTNRFGDCKDHAVLLDALLKAVGIESVPVLIQADLANYTLPDVVAPQYFFNHMISYLPGMDLYLDSTSVVTEFGRLPETDQGKPVLRAGLSKALGITPVSGADARQTRRLTKVRVNADGSARVVTTLWFSGDFRDWFDQFRQEVGNGKENVWATQQLVAQKKRGQATLKWLSDVNGARGVSLSQTIENYLPESEIGLLDFAHAYVGGVSILPVLDLFESRSRSSSFNCKGLDIKDTVEISLPDNLKLLRLPRDQDVSVDGIRLRVRYAEKNGLYEMTRSFRWEPPGTGSCSVSNWQEWLQPMRKIRSAVRSAVLAYERI